LISGVWYGTVRLVDTLEQDLEIGEKRCSLSEFLVVYNANLPESFPRASTELLKKFRLTYPALFEGRNSWSLGKHRKKFMDWPVQRAHTTQK